MKPRIGVWVFWWFVVLLLIAFTFTMGVAVHRLHLQEQVLGLGMSGAPVPRRSGGGAR